MKYFPTKSLAALTIPRGPRMNNIPRNDDDQLETRLRRALNSEAAMAQPAGDGLTKIRESIDARRHRAWWRNPALALVAAAVLGVAVGGLYFGSRDNGTTTVAGRGRATHRR